MRKIIVTEAVSLDGVMESPDRWLSLYNSNDQAEDTRSRFPTFDAVLLGRVTYEEFAAYWPFQTSDDSGIADKLNSVVKFVASNTLQKADWNNSTLITGNIPEEVLRLKQLPGKDISITGSGELVNSLGQHDLIDEYRLMVYPIVVGSGKRLFRDGSKTTLKLVETKRFSSGVVALTYQPVRKE